MSTLFVLGGVGVAILLESLASASSRTPRSLTSHPNDATLRTLALAASLLLLSATIYAALQTVEVSLAVVSAGLIAVGGWLRATAIRNLGAQFRTEAGAERLVTTGIHALMRHPSELGLICWTVGLFVAAPGLIAGALAGAQLPLLLARLGIEETALADRFGDRWRHYANETPRLGV